MTSTLTHMFLYYRRKIRIWIQARRSLSERPDIHARLMSVYTEVPDWWYLTIFGSCANSYGRARECTNILFSVHVRVWYRFHRGVGYAITRMGFGACPRRPCVF
jgi:OPT oligopeptide transporter protein